jgi:hypothetical protein
MIRAPMIAFRGTSGDGVGDDVVVLGTQRGGFDDVHPHAEDLLELDEQAGELE